MSEPENIAILRRFYDEVLDAKPRLGSLGLAA